MKLDRWEGGPMTMFCSLCRGERRICSYATGTADARVEITADTEMCALFSDVNKARREDKEGCLVGVVVRASDL